MNDLKMLPCWRRNTETQKHRGHTILCASASLCSFCFSLPLILGLLSCQQSSPPNPLSSLETSEFRQSLEEQVLFVWYPRIIDTVHGGYISDWEYDWTPSARQTKFIVSQARGLWTAAKALEFYPNNEDFKRAAAHGLEYFRDVMWDQDYGGFHTNAPDFAREEELQYKIAYGNAFGIYALSQYAKVSGSEAAQALALQTFHWLEESAYDSVHGGYFNQITREGISAASPDYEPALFPPASWGDPSWKDQNTSIHLLEAFSTLYEVAPEPLVKERLEEMLLIVRDQMVHENGYLRLNFTRDLEPISYRDSGRAVVQERLRWDHVSFGHDIETAYLLLEAAHVLGWHEDEQTERVAKKLVDHTLATGFAENYQGILEGGYYFEPGGPIEILNGHKTWWAQIEALNSLLLMAQKYPEEPLYAEAFVKMWEYCQSNFIDQTHGGWYSSGLDQEPEVRTQKKASAWKSAYHTARGMMNIVQAL
jgi:mannobiose 2-epimerase